MAHGSKSWKTRVYNQTPYFITVIGYVIALGMLLGAASTWLIHVSVFAQAGGSLRPEITRITRDRDCIVIERLKQPGDQIEAGEPFVSLIENPENVAQMLLRSRLLISRQEYEKLNSDLARRKTLELDYWIETLPEVTADSVIRAPLKGWVMGSSSSSPTATDIEGFVPAGLTIAEIAQIQSATLNLELTMNRAPTVQQGESTRVLIADWGKEPLTGEILSVDCHLSLTIPRTRFEEEELEQLQVEQVLQVEIGGVSYLGELAFDLETVRVMISGNQMEREELLGVKSAGSVDVVLPQLGHRKIRTKWESVQARLAIGLRQENMPPFALSRMEEQLSQGINEIPIASCWARVGSQRLFRKLFDK